MNKLSILITSVSFYPRITPRSFRTTELATELARQGHDVTVLTNTQGVNYTEFSKTNNLKVVDFVHGKWNETSQKNIATKFIIFLLNYFFLYPSIRLTFLLKKTLINFKGYDLLISVAAPHPVHWGVALAKKKNKNLCKTWIADCGDPFMGNKEHKIGHPFYFHLIENWFCKKPDFLTVPIKEAITAYPKFCRHKIRVIPQGFNFSKSTTSSVHIESPYPVFAYAGLLSKGLRDPRQFLEYLCTKRDQKFKFIIYTRNSRVVSPYKEHLGDKLEIRDYVPREILLTELRKMSFLVNFENTNSVQSPSKLIDYAIIGKPILSVTPNNINSANIDCFLNGDYSNQLVIENMEQYDIKNVALKFIGLAITNNDPVKDQTND